MPEWLKTALVVAVLGVVGWLFTQELNTEARLVHLETENEVMTERFDKIVDKIVALLEKGK